MKHVALFLAALASPAIAQEGEPMGAWHFKTISDPMTDASRGIAVTDIKNEITLVVKCDADGDNQMYMSFITTHYLGGTSSPMRDISYRIDGAPVQRIEGYFDGKSANLLHLSPSNSGGRFLKAIMGSTKLTVQVADFEGETYTSVIDTSGAKAAIDRVATVCKDASMKTFLDS